MEIHKIKEVDSPSEGGKEESQNDIFLNRPKSNQSTLKRTKALDRASSRGRK